MPNPDFGHKTDTWEVRGRYLEPPIRRNGLTARQCEEERLGAEHDHWAKRGGGNISNRALSKSPSRDTLVIQKTKAEKSNFEFSFCSNVQQKCYF